jgi:hypothetical protein
MRVVLCITAKLAADWQLWVIRAIIPDLTKTVRHGNILPPREGCHGQAQATETRPPAYRR